MKKLSQQAKSRTFTEKKHNASSSNTLLEFFQTTYKSSSSLTTPHPPPPITTTPLCEVIGLFSSSNLQVTNSRVSISVFKGRHKLLIRHILIGQSFLKPFETIGDKTTLGKEGRNSCLLTPTYGDVITKFSCTDRLRPIFIAMEAPPRALRTWRLRYELTYFVWKGAWEHATGVYAK